MDPSDLMRLAIEKCRQGIAAGQSPFGCAIARDGEVLSCSHNTVVLTTDITAHAEVNAIREACRADRQISSSTARSWPPPASRARCAWPHCIGPAWTRCTTARRSPTPTTAGFNELQLPAAELLRIGGSKLKLVPQVLPEECKQLFAEWKANPKREVY